MYTTKTVTVERKGIMGRPLTAKTLHQIIRADGEVLRNCDSIEQAQEIAAELNAFEASPPKFGDLQAEFIRIAGQ